jgi:hypothetical protein
VRFRVRFLLAACSAACFSSPVNADDIGAAARGVVRVIVAAEDYSDPENSSVSFGSGFAISPHHIVTNAHVVEAAENGFTNSVVAIVPAEGDRPLKGNIIAYDPARDLAIVDVGSMSLEPLAIYSGPVDPGEHSAALGYPGNVDLATVTSLDDLITPTSPVRSEGNISSERTINGMPALLHTAAISRGNSGGPLVDECGRVLGVNTYVTRSGSGDAPFGFATISQELMAFLREHGEDFHPIGTACITAAQMAQREQQAREAAARAEAVAKDRIAAEQQRRLGAAKADVEDERQNHVVGSALLVLLSLIAGAGATTLLVKDRGKAAGASAAVAVFGLAAGAYAFFSRPSSDVKVSQLTTSASAALAPIEGELLCQVKPELSRVIVSSTDDLAMFWNTSGCMNGRTQYVEQGATWRRVLVPNGSETVYVQDFDPTKGQYVSTRYLLSQMDMNRLRQVRRAVDGETCNSNPETIQKLQEVTDQLAGSLPATPNEKLVYSCREN